MITRIIPSLITIKDFSLFSCSEEEMIAQFNNYSNADLDSNCKVASSVLMKYIFETQKMTLSNINILDRYYIVNYMTIDIVAPEET